MHENLLLYNVDNIPYTISSNVVVVFSQTFHINSDTTFVSECWQQGKTIRPIRFWCEFGEHIAIYLHSILCR